MKNNEYFTMLKSFVAKASYPITGNLSWRCKDKLEEILGEDAYCMRSAGNTASIFNLITYPSVTVAAGVSEAAGLSTLLGIALFGFGYALFENISFAEEWREKDYSGRKVDDGAKSMLGAVVSLPLEMLIDKYDKHKWDLLQKKIRNNHIEERIRENIEKQKEIDEKDRIELNFKHEENLKEYLNNRTIN